MCENSFLWTQSWKELYKLTRADKSTEDETDFTI